MLPQELIDLVQMTRQVKAEGQQLEVKAAHKGCPQRLYDTLSSFSNQDAGGILLFGLDEKQAFQLVGVYDLQQLQQQVTEQCKQMQPPVRAVFTTASVDGQPVCAAEIPGIDPSERPCFYKGAGRLRGSYLRVGDADLLMTDYELYSFEAFRKHLHDDERPIERASLAMLNQERLNLYLGNKREERPQFAQLSKDQSYEMLSISRNGVPTLAAIMNFGIYPQGYLPQLCITAIVVPGKQIGDQANDSARFTDNKRIEGTLSTMAEDALTFCKRNMRTRTIIDPDTGLRADRTEYPINAIREAVLNALIHRDYSHYTEGTPIQLDFFTDRLEIHSPGGLYGRMTIDQLGYAHPDLRNPTLAVMAETLTDAENRYSGIPTIRREMAAYGLPQPRFENRRDEFVVTLYNTPLSDLEKRRDAEDRASDLLAFCKEPRSRSEIAAFVKVKTISFAMKKYVVPLLQSGKLAMTFPDKPQSRNQRYYCVRE